MIIDKKDIVLIDFLGGRIELGDTFQAYRPRTIRKITTANTLTEVILPAAWFFGQLQLNLEKGLVIHIKDIHYPKGIQEGEKEITKVGWRLKVARSKFSLLKVSSLITGNELKAFLPYAKGAGIKNLRKHKLIKPI